MPTPPILNRNFRNHKLQVYSLRVGAPTGTISELSQSEVAVLDGVTAGTVTASKAVVVDSNKDIGDLRNVTVTKISRGAPASAGSADTIVARKTGIADNTATAVLTVTVPNGNHNAALFLDIMAHLGAGTDASESTRVATGAIAIARTTGAATVATAATLGTTAIATTSGGGTLTLAYGVSAMTGAVGATQTFDVQVTLVVTGTITNHTAVVFGRLVNSAATGVTVAAAA